MTARLQRAATQLNAGVSWQHTSRQRMDMKPDMRPMRQKTLNELEGFVPSPPTYPSALVNTCHRLRAKPIGQFSAEDLRIMIGQKIGLAFLIPLALERLEADPWVAGDLYPGDLLKVSALASDAGPTRPELRNRLRAVIDRALGEVPTLRYDDEDGLPNLDVPGPELAAELTVELQAARERLGKDVPPAS